MSSRGVNKVIIIGNLGQDPEVRYTQNSTAIANLSVATSEQWKDKQTGEPREQTEWHRCVAYRRLAEICGEYLRKGSKVYIEGKLQTRKWQGQDGQDRYTTEIVVQEMQMLDSQGNGMPASIQRNAQGNSRQQQQGGQQATQQPAMNQQQPNPQAQNQASQDFDDDIPFAPIGKQYGGLVNAL